MIGMNGRSIRVFHVVNILYWLSLYTYTSYISPFSASLGSSSTEVGIIAGSYGFAMLICRIPIGILSDRLHRRKIFVMAGSLCTCIAALGMGMATSPAVAAIFRTISGVGASTWVCSSVLFNSYYPPEKSDTAIAAANLTSGVGRCIAGVAGALAAAWAGMQGAFFAGAIAGLLGFIGSLFLEETRIKSQPVRLGELLRLLKEPSLILAGVGCALHQMTCYATGFSFASDLAQNIGASTFQIGLLGMMLALGTVIGTFLLPRYLSPHISEKKLLLLCLVVTAGTCVIFPLMRTIFALFAVQICVGIIAGILGAIFMAMSIRFVPEEKKATAMGIYQALYAGGILLGPIITGILIDGVGYNQAFNAMGVVALIDLLLIWWGYDRSQTARAGD